MDDSARNMALDEVLAEGACDLVVRVYRWKELAFTYGYFTPYASVAGAIGGLDHTRRLTGGGLVEHGGDITLTVVVPRDLAGRGMDSATMYRLVHGAVADAMVAGGGGGVRQVSECLRSRADEACFARLVTGDLVRNGRKVAGGALRRMRRSMLYQGSLQGGDAPGFDARKFAALLGSGGVVERDGLDAKLAARAEELARYKYALEEWKRKR